MKKTIFGDRYNYLLELAEDKKFYFEIYAKYVVTNQVSIITNLNCIISEFIDISENNPGYYETTWEFDEIKEADFMFKIAQDLFSSKYFIRYLEDQLDEDRELGGWNSCYRF
ncbi:MAG: hypothetical protein GF353_11285 [Candidatus Lokiarchaeota archaeon]|nr:hypothetical protein [Candidatus Lokiarchaeota archaeon]